MDCGILQVTYFKPKYHQETISQQTSHNGYKMSAQNKRLLNSYKRKLRGM